VFACTQRCTRINLLYSFNANNPRKFLQNLIANPVQKRRAHHHGAGLAGNHVQSTPGRYRGKEVVPKQGCQLGHGIWLTIAKRRTFKMRPNATPIGDNNQQTALATQNTPNLAKKLAGLFSVLQCMDHQDPVNRLVRQGKAVFFNESNTGWPCVRPKSNPPLGWHKGKNTF